jgi:primosomal protein N' (replication factor Y) (superfamily II helicase)
LSQSKQQSLFSHDLLPPQPEAWELAAEADCITAQVVFNRPLETAFHYLVPDELRELIGPGQRVKAPFGRGNQLTVGYCVGLEPPPALSKRLKSIDSVIDREPLFDAQMLELTRWIAERYLCSWGQVLEMVVPSGVKKKAGTRIIKFLQAAPNAAAALEETNLPAKQRAVLEVLCTAGRPLRIDELTEAADCGTGPVEALRRKGLIQALRQRTDQFVADFGPSVREADLELNPEQTAALESVLAAVRSNEHRTLLLHGVTGSGKTEVYIRAIREIVAYGRQAIVLVPEISLTPQTIRRFRSRFDSVAVLHSHLSDPERHWHWQQIARGAVQVIVGARSAVFAPVPHLGLIVIDEEHETSFKQDSAPRYHAREVARQRAAMAGIPLILGSATPTLDSWLRVQQEHDVLVSMPSRIACLPMPPVSIVDMRDDPRRHQGEAVGRALQNAMRAALADQGQIILFLNVRGFSPILWCRACGEGVKCPECDITLTWHKDRNIALCHFCDFHTTPPSHCPRCQHAGLVYLGIGTQRLEQEVQAKFPGVRCLRMDGDSMRKPGSHDSALAAFGRGDVQILLGTQMIAKGLDFPNVTLVGVIDADTMLHQPDMRSTERTFQLIAQVAGRTGRSKRGGRVLVQTSCPNEPSVVFAARHDYVGFAQFELKNRRQMESPPFHHLVRVIVRGHHEPSVKQEARSMTAILREAAEKLDLAVSVLGPAPAPVARLKSYFRYHFQLSAEKGEHIRQLWRSVSDKVSRAGDVEFAVDVDPLNMR